MIPRLRFYALLLILLIHQQLIASEFNEQCLLSHLKLNQTFGRDDSQSRKAKAYLETLDHPLIARGPPESKALKRVGVVIEAPGQPVVELSRADPDTLILRSRASKKIYAGVEYVEFPNSTMAQTIDQKTGKPRSFLLTRGVRKYETRVNLNNGTIAPQGYVSDVLLFEIIKGRAFYRKTLLRSNPENNIFFEDPRVSTIYGNDGKPRFFLSGTDYSSHLDISVNPDKNPDVMNRYVELNVDSSGMFEPVQIGSDGRPQYKNLSPFPKSKPNQMGHTFIDAKNATITQNELGHIVVRTRMRPDFSDKEIMNLAGSLKWKYAEQIFEFENMKEMQAYDWQFAMEDLFGKKGKTDRIRPLQAKVLMKDSQLMEQIKDVSVNTSKGKGMGPGTTPVRFERRGNQLWISSGKNAPAQLASEIPRALQDKIGLVDGQVSYISFDHEIRYLKDERDGQSFDKRHYSVSGKKFDPTLTQIEAYYADMLQPNSRLETGAKTGIGDLQHLYPMGSEVILDSLGKAIIRFSMGISDAHTELVEVDPLQLLLEFSPGSDRWKTGQIYSP